MDGHKMKKLYYLDLFLSLATFVIVASMTHIHNLISFISGMLLTHIIWTMLFKNKVMP